MLWSAGLEAPRQVWVHGWLLAAGGERMSKSRGNFLDPNDFVAAFGADGARYVVLREVPFDRDAEVSWDSFVRRYNADLANDFGNLVNRTVSMANRYLDGERPAPRPRRVAAGRRLGGHARARTASGSRRCLLHDALAELWEFVGGANQARRRREAVGAGQGREGRRRRGRASALRGVLGDLVEACRLVALAAAPFMPGDRAARPGAARLRLPYAADGNGGPPLLDELAGAPGRGSPAV